MKSIEPADVLSIAEKHLRLLPSLRVKIEDSRHWQSTAPGMASAETRPQEALFDEWRNRFVLDTLTSAQAAETNLHVAIVDQAGLLAALLAAAGYKTSTFSFKPDCESPTGAIAGNGIDFTGHRL